ncbi:MAG TPA: 2-oxoglutarate dehydrogenase E1 component [Longimicrobiales bacterium]
MERANLFDSYNAGYAQEQYDRYLQNPAFVDEAWRNFFAAGGAAETGLITVEGAVAAPAVTPAQLRTAVAAAELVDAYRLHGHLAAHLDPLGSPPVGHPMLALEYHGITPQDLEALPASLLGIEGAGATMADAIARLREVYTGTIGYEFEHLEQPDRREWLRRAIESGEYRRPLSADAKKRLLGRLSEVEALEQFLHRAYLGQKRFSIEGTDMMVPMLDQAIERAAAAGAREVVIGMAHRGRLNVLTHVVGRPYQTIIAEFEGAHAGFGTTGDVKYHLGAEGTYATLSGEPLNVVLVPNPSHLEFVDPVVEGMARARQTDRSGRDAHRDPNAVLPILIHGDAAFAGQGVVPETLNLARLNGYRTGGTLHIIANNQIGFTTTPREGRSTRYASDLARGFDIPIFHVNADDPEACLSVVRLALAYREAFGEDVLIDLVGYRRYGHNEGDEPSYTQPVMYDQIGEHPSVRKLWASTLVDAGVVAREEADALYDEAYQRLIEAQKEVKERSKNGAGKESAASVARAAEPDAVETAVAAERLAAFDRQLHAWPDGFHVNPKLARQLERRSKAFAEGGPFDWAHAEALAFASLLADGTPIRLTGQDAQRGTFSQRHLVLHDVETGETYTPVGNIAEARASFEVYNSPLSELAAMGFEYGFSVAAPESLVLWEGQFGDFVNGAQVIIDQFVSAGQAKWGQTCGLVLLLPHGYEGQGPEHSSARMERFLQLAAEGNLRVADCSTPAQYFHLLRLQAATRERRPLVIFTPKSLLRHPRATSRLDDLTGGAFRPVLDDDDAADRRDEVTRVVLCTGKVFYDLTTAEARDAARNVAIIRVEQLYPFPEEEIAATLDRFPNRKEIVWVQEEPENMGAWRFMEPRLRTLAGKTPVRYVGRPERAAPAEGYLIRHEAQQSRIVNEALTGAPARSKPRAGSTRRRT